MRYLGARRDTRRTVDRNRSDTLSPSPCPSFSTSLLPSSRFYPPLPLSLLTLISLTLDALSSLALAPFSCMYTRAHSSRLPLKKTRARIESPLVYRVFAASATLSTRADEPSNIESGGVIEFALVSMRADRRPMLKGGAPPSSFLLPSSRPLGQPRFPSFIFSLIFRFGP